MLHSATILDHHNPDCKPRLETDSSELSVQRPCLYNEKMNDIQLHVLGFNRAELNALSLMKAVAIVSDFTRLGSRIHMTLELAVQDTAAFGAGARCSVEACRG